jgi:hypothetical protein
VLIKTTPAATRRAFRNAADPVIGSLLSRGEDPPTLGEADINVQFYYLRVA